MAQTFQHKTTINMGVYFTISHADTHKPLNLGGPLTESRARNILLAARPESLVKTEWYVTEWYGNGSNDDEIISQISADEWLATRSKSKGLTPGGNIAP